MKRATWVTLLVTGAMLTLGVGAACARTSYPSEITHEGSFALPGGKTLDTGQLTSSSRLCAVLRPVKLIAHYPGDNSRQLLDIDITSVFGAWATKADLSGADRVRAVAPQVVLHVHHHRKVCQSAAVGWALA